MIVAINLLTSQKHLFAVGGHLDEGKRINFPFRAQVPSEKGQLSQQSGSKEIFRIGESLLVIRQHLNSHAKINSCLPQSACP